MFHCQVNGGAVTVARTVASTANSILVIWGAAETSTVTRSASVAPGAGLTMLTLGGREQFSAWTLRVTGLDAIMLSDPS